MHGTMLKNTQFWILLGLVGLAVFMVAEPSSAVTSAAYGLKLWATVVVPALLPFFIVAELLVSMGLVRFFGSIARTGYAADFSPAGMQFAGHCHGFYLGVSGWCSVDQAFI